MGCSALAVGGIHTLVPIYQRTPAVVRPVLLVASRTRTAGSLAGKSAGTAEAAGTVPGCSRNCCGAPGKQLRTGEGAALPGVDALELLHEVEEVPRLQFFDIPTHGGSLVVGFVMVV